jgi:hypothetical protein
MTIFFSNYQKIVSVSKKTKNNYNFLSIIQKYSYKFEKQQNKKKN